jgi:hypothetical protein
MLRAKPLLNHKLQLKLLVAVGRELDDHLNPPNLFDVQAHRLH